jgi:hypothetical protein
MGTSQLNPQLHVECCSRLFAVNDCAVVTSCHAEKLDECTQDYNYSLFVFRRFQQNFFHALLSKPRPIEAYFSGLLLLIQRRTGAATSPTHLQCVYSRYIYAGARVSLADDKLALHNTNGLQILSLLDGL